MSNEAPIQKAITDYLTKAGVKWARNNSGRRGKTKFGLRAPGLKSGGPDLVVFPSGIETYVCRSVADARRALKASGGLAFGLEVKNADGGLSEDQEAWVKHFGGTP